MQPDIQTICLQLRKHKPLKHIAKELGLPYQSIGRISRGYLYKSGPHNKTIEPKLRQLHKKLMATTGNHQ
jgi:hypothetical protein